MKGKSQSHSRKINEPSRLTFTSTWSWPLNTFYSFIHSLVHLYSCFPCIPLFSLFLSLTHSFIMFTCSTHPHSLCDPVIRLSLPLFLSHPLEDFHSLTPSGSLWPYLRGAGSCSAWSMAFNLMARCLRTRPLAAGWTYLDNLRPVGIESFSKQ